MTHEIAKTGMWVDLGGLRPTRPFQCYDSASPAGQDSCSSDFGVAKHFDAG
jgi:hypothetical protein